MQIGAAQRLQLATSDHLTRLLAELTAANQNRHGCRFRAVRRNPHGEHQRGSGREANRRTGRACRGNGAARTTGRTHAADNHGDHIGKHAHVRGD